MTVAGGEVQARGTAICDSVSEPQRLDGTGAGVSPCAEGTLGAHAGRIEKAQELTDLRSGAAQIRLCVRHGREEFQMSEEGFEVKGPHEHAIEHGAASGEKFASHVAVLTAVLSTIGAVFSFQGGTSQNEALMLKNDAAIRRTEATDFWNQYQAKSSKENIAALGVDLLQGERHDQLQREVARYEKEKQEIRAKAEKLEAESVAFNKESAAAMHQHHYWAQATTALQIAIAMAAISLLSRRRGLEYLSFVFAAVGIAIGAYAWFWAA